VLDIVVLGRAGRNAANLKNRQPLAKMYVKADYEIPEYFKAIIRSELNVKAVEEVSDAESFVTYTFKPQMRTVGPKYGKLLGKIKAALAEIDGNAAMKELNEDGTLALDVNGTRVVLEKEDLLIDMAQTEGFETQSYGGITVVLDKALTPELIEEGFVRELVSKIQTMRKEAGFEVMDRITVYASGNEKIEQILRDNEKSVAADVLADGFIFNETDGYVKEWKINTEKVTLGVKKN
jgi:isoleucyl-tRNA synthetase